MSISKNASGESCGGAATGFALEVQVAFEPGSTQTHVLQPIAGIGGVRVETDTIIRHAELPETVSYGNNNFDARGLGVFGDIGQHLLEKQENILPELRRQNFG